MPNQAQRAIQTEERRRYPRVEVAWNVAVGWGPRFNWQGEMVSLSPFGVKVKLGEKDPGPPVGTEVQLQFAPPDKKAHLSINGVVWRVDPDGLAETPRILFAVPSRREPLWLPKRSEPYRRKSAAGTPGLRWRGMSPSGGARDSNGRGRWCL